MSDNTDDIGLVTEQELCKQLGISAVTVQRMRYEGWGPKFVVLGPRRIAYRPSAISEWLTAREVQQGVAHRVNTNVVAKEGGDRGSGEELIAQLRAENKKFYAQAEMNARLLTENASLRAENEKLRVELNEQIVSSKQLRDFIVQYSQRYGRMREALKPFAYYASQIPEDVSNTASASGTVGDLRAAAAALRESE